jgi:hypothetical protein
VTLPPPVIHLGNTPVVGIFLGPSARPRNLLVFAVYVLAAFAGRCCASWLLCCLSGLEKVVTCILHLYCGSTPLSVRQVGKQSKHSHGCATTGLQGGTVWYYLFCAGPAMLFMIWRDFLLFMVADCCLFLRLPGLFIGWGRYPHFQIV